MRYSNMKTITTNPVAKLIIVDTEIQAAQDRLAEARKYGESDPYTDENELHADEEIKAGEALNELKTEKDNLLKLLYMNTHAVKVIAERMIIESRTDEHRCKTIEAYCAGCQKMRDALRLLQLMGDPTVVRV